jgi:hypothetical protein
MAQWLGEAPEWFLKRFREFEQDIQGHAENYARSYFEQFKKSEQQLIRGPDAEAGLRELEKTNPVPVWTEQKHMNVSLAALYRYNEYMEREYHRLLIRELLTAS